MESTEYIYSAVLTSINRKIRTGAGALKYQKASGAVDEDWNTYANNYGDPVTDTELISIYEEFIKPDVHEKW